MEYHASDSSGTDDDLPRSHQTRGASELMTRNGRTIVGAPSYLRVQSDMETQIHLLEQEAYSSVLRAFKAQSDAITWEKESLITELRKELRVSSDEHRELLSRVNADDIIRRIREWRQQDDPTPSPTIPASHKRQWTPMAAPSSTSMKPSSTSVKPGVSQGSKGRKTKPGQILPEGSAIKSLQYHSTAPSGRDQITNRSSGTGTEPAEAVAYDPLIGRKVITRWPDDNKFYEAVITDYDPHKGHRLVYGIGTTESTWEWVNLQEFRPEDIRWEGEDPCITNQTYLSGAGAGIKTSIGRGGVPGKGLRVSQNDAGTKGSADIEILHTGILIKEVERVFSSSHPDPREMETAKKMLREQEQSLTDAISRLDHACNGESDQDDVQFSHGQSRDQERGWMNHEYAETAWT